jgi:Flp pilus assembly pilin Flp
MTILRLISQGFSWLKLQYFANVRGQVRSAVGISEQGTGLVEYALLLVFIAIAVIATLGLLGPGVGNAFSNIYCEVFYVGDGKEGSACG